MTVSVAVADAVRSCLGWARSTSREHLVDPASLTRLLTVHGQLRSDPGDWDRDDVTRVVLTLSAGGALPEGWRDTWLAWIDHLVDRGLLGPGESPRALRAAVAAIDPPPVGRAPWPTVGDDGPWWGPPWEPDDLPRVHLLPAAPCAPRARDCADLERALRLAEWAGDGLPLAEGAAEALPEPAADEAATHLGLAREEVERLLEVALRAGFLRATYTEVRPGPALLDWDDDTRVVRAWVRALPAMTERHGTLGSRILGELFTSGGVWSVSDLVEVLAPWPAAPPAVPAPRAAPPAEARPLRSAEERVRAVVADLVRLGAAEEVAGAGLRITPLGDHAMAHRWRRWGVRLPGYPPTGAMTARELLFQLWEGRPVDAGVLGRAWLAGRGATGVRELLEVCAELGSWRQRLEVFRLLDGLGEGCEREFEVWRDHPVLGGWIAHARAEPGRVRLEQLVVVLLDTYALRVELGAPLPADAPLWRDPEAVTGLMWRSGHPAADGVLTAIARGALGSDAARAACRVRLGPVAAGT
ncbi:hypothetical protein [Nocardiopsis sp. NPDC006938]|uniref:hypothetical protein n=1 Tax=Nocardiopsis sp. NPDC006938 TaxID=3364337 RepID=UPI00367A3964